MRIAVISDIHGNCLALETALADFVGETIDRMVCLGDAVQGGPQPAQVVARLRALNCPVVMGNADAWLLTGVDTGHEPITPERMRKMEAIRAWSLAQLSADDQRFIQGFQPTVELALDSDRSLLCFHGSPASFDDIILPDLLEADFQKFLSGHGSSVLTGGHTHLPQVRRLGDSFFFNPGSVGLAYSHQQPDESFKADRWAEYAILTAADGRLRLEFRRVDIDADALIAIYLASGRPYAEEAATQYRR